jgi:hypothetical protein
MPASSETIIRLIVRNLLYVANPTLVVVETSISADQTLFPEKVAKAKKTLQNATFSDPRFGF